MDVGNDYNRVIDDFARFNLSQDSDGLSSHHLSQEEEGPFSHLPQEMKEAVLS